MKSRIDIWIFSLMALLIVILIYNLNKVIELEKEEPKQSYEGVDVIYGERRSYPVSTEFKVGDVKFFDDEFTFKQHFNRIDSLEKRIEILEKLIKLKP